MPFFKNKKEEVSLLIDIGNGSIGAAFVLFSDGLPKVLYNTRLPFVVVDNLNSSKLEQGMEILLDETLGKMVKRGFEIDFWARRSKRLSFVLVSFSSPWFVEKTKDIHISEEKTFVITKRFLDSILKKEEEIFRNELQKNSTVGETPAFVVVEESIVHTKINGYILDRELGKKTNVFDLTLCLAVLPRNIVSKVRTIITKHTNISENRVKMHTFPLISFTVLRDIFPNITDFIIMDITSEVTELTLVRDNAPSQTVSFPFGRNFIIRQMAKTLNTPTIVAESTLRLYSANKVDSSVLDSMQNLLSSAEKEWVVYFEDALSRLPTQTSLPSRIYITSDSDVAPIFIEFIKLPKIDSTANFRKNADVVHVNHDLLSHLYQSNPGGVEDEFIAILSIFYNKMRG